MTVLAVLSAISVQLLAPRTAVADALGPPVFGPPVQTAQLGGATGTPAVVDCQTSEVLTQVTATVNELGWLTAAQGFCADLQVTPSSVVLGSVALAGSISGFRDTGGSQFPISSCPEDAVVTGVQGKGGRLVDGLQVLCRPLLPDGTLGGEVLGAYAGGPGGSPEGPFRCAEDAVATGFFGGVGQDLDSFGLTCRVLGFPSTAPEDINVSWPTALPVSGNSSTQGAITAPGQDRWYRFPVLPGSRVEVNLTGLPADYDLTLFKDIGQAFNTLTTTDDLTLLSAEFAADAFSPSAFSPSAFSPSAFSPDVFLPSVFSPSAFSPSTFSPSAFSDAFSSAQTRSLIAVSARDGTAPETISSATWTNTGNFYVRVQGRNGAFAATPPYTLAVTTSGGPCGTPLNDHAGDRTLRGTPGRQTVILTDPRRMTGSDQDKAALDQALAGLAAQTDGVVLDLADSAKVTALNAQADSAAHLSCPYAKNLVAQATRDIVNSYRGDLKYVVVVGDDSVIPFFRYADSAGLGTESDYVPPVADSTASQASLRSNYVLSQDAYGAANDISVKGSTLPIADVAVGRLVETPTEIRGLVQDYHGRNGAPLRPASTLTTGYDFLTDAADSVAETFRSGIPAGSNDTLITDRDVPPSVTTVNGAPDRRHSWTATDLRQKLFGTRHDLTFLAGHFSANSTLAADYDTTVLSTEVLQKPRELFQNSLIFSAGCHSGYTIVDGEGVPGVTVGLDWTQAFARQGATVIAGTGYQYGDTDFLEYSERLYADFARELRTGSAAVPVGGALATAKQSYLATTPALRGIDQKSVLEATLYGLPMFAVDMPSRIPTPTDDSVATPSPVMTVPGSRLGLQVDNLAVNPMLQTVTKTLTNVDGGQVTATYLVGPDGVETNPSEPALPLDRVNVSAPGQVLRGVGFRGGSYTDTDGLTPLTGAPATETASVHTPFLSPAFFPPRLAVPNYFDVLGAAGDGTTRLMLTPAQHRSDETGSLTNTLRRYSGLGLRLYYSGNITTYVGGNTPALAAAPSLTDIDATLQPDGSLIFQARAVGDPSAGIQEVWVTYTGERGSPLHGEWASLDLIQDPVDSTLWTRSFTPPTGQDPAEIRYVGQAANGVGLVGMDDNQGVYFTPGVTAGAVDPDAVTTSLALGSVPSSATYGANLPVSASLTAASGGPAVGQLVTFTLGGASRSAVTNGSGRAATELPLNVVPGEPYKLTASFDGDAALASSASAAVTVAVSKQPTALTLTRDATGALTATLVGNTGLALREKTVFFAAIDRGGAVLTGSGVITDQQGTAQLNAAQVPTAATAVTAYFGSASTPLPGGDTADLADPSYAPSTSTRVGLPGALTTVADAYSVVGGSTLTVPAPGVLANDTDPRGGPLEAALKSPPANGEVTLRPDGSFTYTPVRDFVGVDSFSYTAASAGLTSAPATVTITVTEPRPPGCTIVGTEHNETLRGTSGRDVICGLGGNDVLIGNNGDDLLYGGSGDDRLDGGNGHDNLQGASGVDTLLGGNDNDTLDGSSGNDRLEGANGNDSIVAGPGLDQLIGDLGNDSLNAVDGVGGDNLSAGSGTDSCQRDTGDTVTGCP